MSHWWIRASVWVRMWAFRLYCRSKGRSQYSHINLRPWDDEDGGEEIEGGGEGEEDPKDGSEDGLRASFDTAPSLSPVPQVVVNMETDVEVEGPDDEDEDGQ